MAITEKFTVAKKPATKKKTGKRRVKRGRVAKGEHRLSNICPPDGMSVRDWQVALRVQQAERATLVVEPVDLKYAPGEFSVHNFSHRSDYKVTYRGADSPWNYCSCPDFKTSGLGTCKHIEAVRMWTAANPRKRFSKELPAYTSVYVDYRDGRKVKLRIGEDHHDEFAKLAARFFDKDMAYNMARANEFYDFAERARMIDDTFRCYPDVLDIITEQRDRDARRKLAATLTDEALDRLLTVKLYPYQKEGIRFAVEAGRSLIADEMGLGKTIQAIGTAVTLLRARLVDSVLVMCPTSLKYQWKREIERFSGMEAHVIEGGILKRPAQYRIEDKPFKIVSYNTACNDIKLQGGLQTDMVIMDEVQRLKNWETQIARAARRIDARYVTLLSGTPLENKLEELYSVMELVDQYALSPYFDFRHRYIRTEETGKIIGYKGLNEIGERLKPYIVRRRKVDVNLQLPERIDEYLLVPITQEQSDVHEDYKSTLARLLHKWSTHKFLSETDRRRLLLCLSCMRMVADSTYILDQKSRHDTKVDEVMNIIEAMVEGGSEKAVIFSEWERMTRLIAQALDARGIRYEYLHGGVPSVKRKSLVDNFTDDPDCRVFLSTDAGSTGLNLQVATLLINMDLPWNPAVLEQRIARIHRIGQRNNIQVINLVSAGTIEETMIGKLKFKSSMFSGVLDGGDDEVMRGKGKFAEMMESLSNVFGDAENEDTTTTIPVIDGDTEAPRQEDEPTQPEPDPVLDDNDGEPEAEPTAAPTPVNDTEVSPAAAEPSQAEAKPAVPSEGAPALGENAHPSGASTHTPSHAAPSTTPTAPTDIVAHGMQFLAGLAGALQSRESTERLVDAIVTTDKETGATHLNIPVPSRDAVANILNAVSALLTGMKK